MERQEDAVEVGVLARPEPAGVIARLLTQLRYRMRPAVRKDAGVARAKGCTGERAQLPHWAPAVRLAQALVPQMPWPLGHRSVTLTCAEPSPPARS